jgi:hypothetical protein
MAIILDGIAKGYTVDQGVGVLYEHGFSNVFGESRGRPTSFRSDRASKPLAAKVIMPGLFQLTY